MTGNKKVSRNKQAESKLHYSPRPSEPKHGTCGNAIEQLVGLASVLNVNHYYITLYGQPVFVVDLFYVLLGIRLSCDLD